MKQFYGRWFALFVLVLLSNAMNLAAAADRVDAKALSIAQQAQVLVKQKGDSALRTAAEFTERNQLLDAATALQAQVEAGDRKSVV